MLSIKQTSTVHLTFKRVNEFFATAAQLIDVEMAIKQEVIRGLHEQGGLERIKAAIEQNYSPRGAAPSSLDVFSKQLLPLFKVITHPDVLVSSILEEELARIFRFLHGVTGERFQKLLNCVADGLEILANPIKDEEALDEAFKMSLQVILQVIESLTEATINTSTHELVGKISEILVLRIAGETCSTDAHEAYGYLRRIQKRLNIGTALPSIDSIKSPNASAAKGKYHITIDPPGGRHSNDHEDITKIAILPTTDEIACVHTEYLPVYNLSENHVHGLNGLLDRSFRLLREDTVGQLRDAVRMAYERLTSKEIAHKSSVRTHIYHNVGFSKVSLNTRKGMEVTVSFDQPLNTYDEKTRKLWWERMKRLEPEALVCLVDGMANVVFATVSQLSKPGIFRNPTEEGQAQFKQLYEDRARARVSLHLTQVSRDAIRPLVIWMTQSTPLALVEFPGVLLPAFKPTLLALQEIKKKSELSLSEFLVPRLMFGDEDELNMDAPFYATRNGFRFNLKCLTIDDADLSLMPGQAFDVEELQRRTSLDPAQAVALSHALTRKLALIQGPPGTGKSYVGVALMRVLLANKCKSAHWLLTTSDANISKVTRQHNTGADIGPILVVCYTNHALDGTLHHLIDAGVEQIVRIGGRSKSERLQDCNLRVLSQKVERTQTEKGALGKMHAKRDALQEHIMTQVEKLAKADFPPFVKYLREEYPEWADRIYGLEAEDEDGFIEVMPKSHIKMLQRWIEHGRCRQNPPRGHEELLDTDQASMTSHERRILHDFFWNEYIEDINSNLSAALEQYDENEAKFRGLNEDNDLRILQNANIIGVTTSGLARQIHLLRKLRAQVLICEEAGEVLEPHILTTFLPSIRHAILIGDHEQLKPQVQNYNLSSENSRGKQYSFDISLFERLIHPSPELMKLPYDTLASQRRMHPSISRLIRETLYADLQDAGKVADYPEVVGMRKRLFWFDHRNNESGNSQEDHQTSHWNKFEVDMTTGLVRHLIAQGAYQPDQIAVLTPYLGQLQHLKQELGKTNAIVLSDRDMQDLENAGIDGEQDNAPANEGPSIANKAVSRTTLLKALRIATIDNFQGEEAEVIILSLVRSNPEKKCGFLNISNRINVALSRAKHGMYIIGDSETAGFKVEMWAKVIAMLAADGNLGPELELQCPRHMETPIVVSQPDDFLRFSPEGGCDLPCADRLACGHKCLSRCHAEILHKAVRCLEECPRPFKGCDHAW